MSNLLEQASLVMIPSGYKEDVVYSEIPIDGSGDLQLTRASNGTRVNSAGLVEVVPWNYIQYSEDFSNAAYTNIRINVTTNSVANPINGTVNADKLIPDTDNGIHALRQTVLFQTVFIYAKKGENDQIAFRDDGNTGNYASFNLTSGTIIDSSNSGGTQSITSVGNGWYLCQITFSTQGEYLLGVYCLSNAYTSGSPTVSYTGNGTNGLYAWGYQANIGSTAKPYFPTTDRLNVPRLTYQNGGGGCPSLLLEKQSTNINTYSEDFSNVAYDKINATITTNQTTSPDGTTNADKLTDDSTNDYHIVYPSILSITASRVTTSVYLKNNNIQFGAVQLATSIGSTYDARFTIVVDLINGTITDTEQIGTPNATYSIENVGNGWYKLIVSADHVSGAVSNLVCGSNSGTPSNFSAALPVYVGTGKSLFLWGMQIENSSYPTSYIPTTSSSATRVADACSKTGISSLIGQTEGVLFVDFELKAYDSLAKWIAFLGGGSYYIGLYTDGSSHFVAEVYDNAFSFLNQTFTFSVGTRYKVAIAYKANDFAYYVNGTQIATDNSGTVPTTSQFDFNYNTTAANLTSRIYNQAILFPTRLTNAELASLTTI